MNINELDISGPGLLFITFPACLSTMAFPNMWILLFFFTMFLIGIDTQFAIVETFCYLIEDILLKLGRHRIPPSRLRGIICLIIFFLGLPIATGGGTYVINLLDTFGYAIPASFVNFVNVFIWVKISNFEQGLSNILEFTKEEKPDLLIGCLTKSSLYITGFMFLVCFFLTFSDGILKGNFTLTFMIVGVLLTCLCLSPSIYFFSLFNDEAIDSEVFGVLDEHMVEKLLENEDGKEMIHLDKDGSPDQNHLNGFLV